MRLNYNRSVHRIFAIGLVAAGLSYAADLIVPTYEAPGTEAPQIAALCAGATTACVMGTETFDSWTGGTFTSQFPAVYGDHNGVISGTYSGGFTSVGANTYGGAGAVGNYPEVYRGSGSTGGSYTLNLNWTSAVPGVNYFGLWFSALDAGNLLQFYDRGVLVYQFSPADFINLVGACNGSNAFCGNPIGGGDPYQQFAFLNFFDTTGYFDQIVFSEPTGAALDGFESDNQTVGYMNPPAVDSGSRIYNNPTGAPEPGTLGLFVAGGILIALGVRRRRLASARIG
jgi:hypothetical protein